MKPNAKHIKQIIYILIALIVAGQLLFAFTWHEFGWLLDRLGSESGITERLQQSAHIGEMFVATSTLIELCVLVFAVKVFNHERSQFRESHFQHRFFSQLSQFNVYVTTLREGPLQGRQCLAEWVERLKICKEAEDQEFYSNHAAHYCQQVYGLLRIIVYAPLSDEEKKDYTVLLETHLQESDRALLDALVNVKLGGEINSLLKQN